MKTIKIILTAFFMAAFTDPLNKRISNATLIACGIFILIQFIRFKLQNA